MESGVPGDRIITGTNAHFKDCNDVLLANVIRRKKAYKKSKMFKIIFQHLPTISLVSGLAGGYYMTVGRDSNIELFGKPARKKKLQYFNEDKGLDASTAKLVADVHDRLLGQGVNPAMLAKVDYFWCNQPDIVTVGNARLLGTSFIGLPVTFLYQSMDQVSAKKSSEKFRSALVLNDDAKKFAIASAYYQLDNNQFAFHVSLPLLALGAYGSFHPLQNILLGKSKLRQFSLIFSMLAWWVMLFYFGNVLVKQIFITAADKKAAELGDEFISGGVEYFTKTVQRNQEIYRVMEGNEDSTAVDAEGNRVYGPLEISEPSFTSRLNNLKKLMEKSEGKDGVET